MGKHTDKAAFAGTLVLYGIVIACLWNRLGYGVEISDEAYYIADGYIIANGSIPFTNNWMLSSAAALLYAPLIKAYTTLTGSTEGIFLFMRQGFLVFKVLFAGVLVWLFHRRFPIMLSLLLPLPYLALSLYSLDNFSYNTLSFSLLLMSCVLLYLALCEEEKSSRALSLIAGIVMALTVLTHAMQLFTTIYVFVLLLIIERIRFKTLFRSGLFVSGGLLTGLIIMVYISVLSGGIVPVLEGIGHMLSAPYWYIRDVGLAYNLEILKEGVRVGFREFVFRGVLVFGGLLLLYSVGKRLCRGVPDQDGLHRDGPHRDGLHRDGAYRQYRDMKSLYIVTLFLTQLIFLVLSMRLHSDMALIMNINVCYMYIMALLLLATKWTHHLLLVLTVFSPFLLNYLLYIPFNYSGIHGRGYILFPGILVSFVLMYHALKDIPWPVCLSSLRKSIVPCLCVVILSGTVAIAFLTGYYSYVYRDAPLSELTYQMEKGVYKGLYTVEERGKAIIYLEEEIRNATTAQDTVLFMDQMPAAYLMTVSEFCAPSTWDILNYSYAVRGELDPGYDSMDDALLQAYFGVSGKEPTKIIYIHNNERLDHLSLDNDGYRFNQYVEEHYVKSYVNDEALFGLVVFEK
ncbi:MAG: hypothetical protein FWG40_00080 [Peptococcaceae bacterium]|nr:hypothetical protein [Peptococcaceae bacterium]